MTDILSKASKLIKSNTLNPDDILEGEESRAVMPLPLHPNESARRIRNRKKVNQYKFGS